MDCHVEQKSERGIGCCGSKEKAQAEVKEAQRKLVDTESLRAARFAMKRFTLEMVGHGQPAAGGQSQDPPIRGVGQALSFGRRLVACAKERSRMVERVMGCSHGDPTWRQMGRDLHKLDATFD